MPLKRGSARRTVSRNVEELVHDYERKGKIGNSRPASKKKAVRQAVAISLRVGRQEPVAEIHSEERRKDRHCRDARARPRADGHAQAGLAHDDRPQDGHDGPRHAEHGGAQDDRAQARPRARRRARASTTARKTGRAQDHGRAQHDRAQDHGAQDDGAEAGVSP